jgi:hypothetical protein
VKNGLLAATIPFNGYARPILLGDGALIISTSVPANAVANMLDCSPVILIRCSQTPHREFDLSSQKTF